MEKRLLVRPAVGTGLILLVPLVMSILDRNKAPGDGWHWDASDFLVMGVLLFGAAFAYELIARKLGKSTHRRILAAAIFLVVVAIWVELAVGGVSQIVHYLTA